MRGVFRFVLELERLPTVIYVFIDTNLWVRLLSQGKPGCEPVFFDEIKELVGSSKITLILPEIVELELEKQWRAFREDVTKDIGKLSQKLDSLLKEKVWEEIEDVRAALPSFLVERRDVKIKDAERYFDQIQQFFRQPQLVKIPLTQELFFLGRKRLMAGRMKRTESNAHSDACIVEAIVGHFKTSTDKDIQFLFCSENIADFALETKEGFVLHPLVKEGLPTTKFFVSLRGMIEFYKSNAKIQEPPKEEVDKAIEKTLEEEARIEAVMDVAKCADPACANTKWFVSPFCQQHFVEHMEALPPKERKELTQAIENVLRTLTYREREILKLRTGLGDGYTYTLEEVGRIFKISRRTARHLEAKAILKMRHPIRARALDKFF